MDFLQNLGIDMYAIGAAIDDDNNHTTFYCSYLPLYTF